MIAQDTRRRLRRWFLTHDAAGQLPSSRWTSKLGPLEDLSHALHDLTRMVYGSTMLVLKRPVSAAAGKSLSETAP